MDKIKDKNTSESFFQLEDLLFWNPLERVKMHLTIAKNLFVLTAFLYFFSLLMTVAGALLPWSAGASFFLYPIFVFSVLWLFYNLCSYAITVYFEKFLFIRYGLLLACIGIFTVITALHLGLYTLILSLLWKN